MTRLEVWPILECLWRGTWVGGLITALFLASSTVWAEPPEGKEEPTETEHDSILVIGKGVEADLPPVAGSVDVIGRSELEQDHVDDTYELFDRLPGVYLSRYNQGIINTDVAIRGFAGDGGTPHAALLIDGVPSNLHNGYGELDQLFPMGMGSLAAIKGTSDASVGLHAVAGVFRVETRADTNIRELEVALGSFEAREAQGYFGFSGGNLAHSYSLGYRAAEGYRDHTDLSKYSLAGRWALGLSPSTSLKVIARTSGYEGDAPGYLSHEEARRNPRSSAAFANQDGGDKTVNHLSFHFHNQARSDLIWSLKAYGQTFERERWVRFSEAGSLQNRFDDQEQVGGSASLEWGVGEGVILDAGIDFQAQDVVEQRFATLGQSRERDTHRVLRDRRYDFDTFGVYATARIIQTARLSWNIGLRADRLGGDFAQIESDGSRSEGKLYDFGTILQPKLNIFFAPNPSWTLFANAGRSYQHPFGASAYTAGDREARDVSNNDGVEVGARWRWKAGLEVRASLWRQDASDEFIVVDGDGRNVGETKREGLDVGLDWRIGSRFTLWLNYSRISTEIENGGDALQDFTGNQLRGIPSYTASLGVQVVATARLRVGAHIDAQGDAFVNEGNLGGRFGGFELVHGTVQYETKWGTWGLELNNLFDEPYEYVFDFSQTGESTIHSPGDGRGGTLSLRVKL